MYIGSLPSEILQHICSLLQDQDDLASCHLVNTRFCAAARAALHRAVPRHPGFLELALQHQYPLRHLNTVELAYCDLGSYLAKAPASLTSLGISQQLLEKPPDLTLPEDLQTVQTLPMADLLQGICSLRRLSCPVLEDNLKFMSPQLAGLNWLMLDIESSASSLQRDFDFQGLTHLTSLTWLTVKMEAAIDHKPMSVIAGLSTLQHLCIPPPRDASHLSALSNLTALDVYIDEARPDFSGEWDHDVSALVQALPQLRLLDLVNYALPATDAGLCQLSLLKKLQHLNIVASFKHSTHAGLVAALATMTGSPGGFCNGDIRNSVVLGAGLRELLITECAFMTHEAMAGIARCTSLTSLTSLSIVEHCNGGHGPRNISATVDMLKALGRCLKFLSIGYDLSRRASYNRTPQDHLLVPAIVNNCPLLAHLQIADPPPRVAAEDPVCATLPHCNEMLLSCGAHAEASVLAHVQKLRRLQLSVGSVNTEAKLASVTAGLQGLTQLECLDLILSVVKGDPLLCMLEALASCSGTLTWLQLKDGTLERLLPAGSRADIGHWGIGESHLRALAALPRLTQLNMYHLHWAEDAVQLGLVWLAAQLPRLKVLNCPDDVLDQAISDASLLDPSSYSGDAVARYELRDLPGRRLRRWPRSKHSAEAWWWCWDDW